MKKIPNEKDKFTGYFDVCAKLDIHCHIMSLYMFNYHNKIKLCLYIYIYLLSFLSVPYKLI